MNDSRKKWIIPADQTPSRRLRGRRWLQRLRHPASFGALRRTTPLSNIYGYDRGRPVDRYYIEAFLEENRQAIHGQVLEVKDNAYTRRFGSGVERSDILDIDPGNPQATLVADLAGSDGLPSGVFDCFVLTQTLQSIYDLRRAVDNSCRLLRPGGVLLATTPAVSRILIEDGLDSDFWRFTPASCRRLFEEVFGPGNVTVRSYGNVLTQVAFLMGLSCEDLSHAELDIQDPYFPVILGVRAERK